MKPRTEKTNCDPLWLYWGRQPMSWLRYMTVHTATLIHDDVRLILRRDAFEQPSGIACWKEEQECKGGDHVGKDWTADATERATEVLWLEDVCPELAEGYSDVHVSDLLSYWLLGHHGGTISDMDIVYFAPLPPILHDVQIALQYWTDISRNVQRRGRVPVDVQRKYKYVPIGFLQGRRSQFWRDRYEEGKARYDARQYESVGSQVLTPHVEHSIISPRIVYPFVDSRMDHLFDDPCCPPLPLDCIGIHWYAGGKQRYNRAIKGMSDVPAGAVRMALEKAMALEEEAL